MGSRTWSTGRTADSRGTSGNPRTATERAFVPQIAASRSAQENATSRSCGEGSSSLRLERTRTQNRGARHKAATGGADLNQVGRHQAMKATHRSLGGRLRSSSYLGVLGISAGLLLSSGCGDSSAESETLGSVSLAQGIYHLSAHVDSNIREDSRGWEVELRVPETTSPAWATGVTGQWYWGFESGFYHTGDG